MAHRQIFSTGMISVFFVSSCCVVSLQGAATAVTAKTATMPTPSFSRAQLERLQSLETRLAIMEPVAQLVALKKQVSLPSSELKREREQLAQEWRSDYEQRMNARDKHVIDAWVTSPHIQNILTIPFAKGVILGQNGLPALTHWNINFEKECSPIPLVRFHKPLEAKSTGGLSWNGLHEAVVSRDGYSIKLRNNIDQSTTAECDITLANAADQKSKVGALSWSRDSKLLAIGRNSPASSVQIIDVQGNHQRTLKVTEDAETCVITALDWSRGSNHLAAAVSIRDKHDKQAVIKTWDYDGRPQETLRGHTDTINDIMWLAGNALLASCSQDGTIKIWAPALVPHNVHGVLTTIPAHADSFDHTWTGILPLISYSAANPRMSYGTINCWVPSSLNLRNNSYTLVETTAGQAQAKAVEDYKTSSVS